MKFMIFLMLVLIFVGLIIGLMYTFSDKDEKKNIRNYKVRFDPSKEKYFIVNELSTHDEPVTNIFGFRIMYTDITKADYVVNIMNS